MYKSLWHGPSVQSLKMEKIFVAKIKKALIVQNIMMVRERNNDVKGQLHNIVRTQFLIAHVRLKIDERKILP